MDILLLEKSRRRPSDIKPAVEIVTGHLASACHWLLYYGYLESGICVVQAYVTIIQ